MGQAPAPGAARAPVQRQAAPGGNVIPFRSRTSRLVRPLRDTVNGIADRDPYAEFLEGVPDLAPNSPFGYLAEGLAPSDEDVGGLVDQLAQQAAAETNTPYTGRSPEEETFGSRGVSRGTIQPLAKLPPSAAPPPEDEPAA